jgi:hypothetical protein
LKRFLLLLIFFGFVSPCIALAPSQRNKVFSPPFDPRDVSVRLVLWLDSSNMGAIICSTTPCQVSTWIDKSENGIVASNATGVQQPTLAQYNGFNTVQFTAGNASNLAFQNNLVLSASNRSSFIVWNHVNATNALSLGSRPSTAGLSEIEWYTDNILYLYDGTHFWPSSAAQSTSGYSQVSSTVVLNTSAALWLNGASVALGSSTASAVAQSYSVIGAGDGVYDNDPIAEYLVYSGIVSDTERRRIEAYLKVKWGTP